MSELDSKNSQESAAENHANLLVESGIVLAVDESHVWVQTQRASACGGCANKSCGTSALSQLFSGTTKPIRVEKNTACNVGDRVELILDESQLLKHTFMAYGLPLLGMFVGAILLSLIFKQQFNEDLLAVMGGGAGLLVGWWFTRIFYRPTRPKLGQVWPAGE